MKPHLLKVSLEPESSFNIRRNKGRNFYNEWHFHPEIELIYIHKGKGTRMIGNNVSRFEPDDLILIGSNLDHMWRCDPEYFSKDSRLTADVTVVYFHRDFLGDKFFNNPELKYISVLLEKAKQGIRITGQTRALVKQLINKMSVAKGIERIVTLLTILDKIAATKEKQVINTMVNQITYEAPEANRLNKIFHHTITNFQNNISLPEIAGVANLSPKSFCRYFKAKTRKTYYDFLLEIKIAHACNLLSEKDMTILEVCFESGFNNLSNFNRYFKKFMKQTPTEYRKERRELTD